MEMGDLKVPDDQLQLTLSSEGEGPRYRVAESLGGGKFRAEGLPAGDYRAVLRLRWGFVIAEALHIRIGPSGDTRSSVVDAWSLPGLVRQLDVTTDPPVGERPDMSFQSTPLVRSGDGPPKLMRGSVLPSQGQAAVYLLPTQVPVSVRFDLRGRRSTYFGDASQLGDGVRLTLAEPFSATLLVEGVTEPGCSYYLTGEVGTPTFGASAPFTNHSPSAATKEADVTFPIEGTYRLMRADGANGSGVLEPTTATIELRDGVAVPIRIDARLQEPSEGQ